MVGKPEKMPVFSKQSTLAIETEDVADVLIHFEE
jgi:hypothetical protein